MEQSANNIGVRDVISWSPSCCPWSEMEHGLSVSQLHGVFGGIQQLEKSTTNVESKRDA